MTIVLETSPTGRFVRVRALMNSRSARPTFYLLTLLYPVLPDQFNDVNVHSCPILSFATSYERWKGFDTEKGCDVICHRIELSSLTLEEQKRCEASFPGLWFSPTHVRSLFYEFELMRLPRRLIYFVPILHIHMQMCFPTHPIGTPLAP